MVIGASGEGVEGGIGVVELLRFAVVGAEGVEGGLLVFFELEVFHF